MGWEASPGTKKYFSTESAIGAGIFFSVALFAAIPLAFVIVNGFNVANPGHPFAPGLERDGRRLTVTAVL